MTNGLDHSGAREPRSGTSKPVRLFCLHHAGGSAQMYRDWQRQLPEIDLRAIELPGRGRRLAAPLLSTVVDMAATTATSIGPLMDRPFAVFGHSMGALVGFELARRLTEPARRHLQCLFVSAAAAPHVPYGHAFTGDESDAELLAHVMSLGGTPEEVGDDPELVAMLAPILRADFQAVASYRYAPGPLLACSVVAFGGRQDSSVRPDQVAAWRPYTTGSFKAFLVDGDHFFIRNNPSEVLTIVDRVLRGSPAAPSIGRAPMDLRV